MRRVAGPSTTRDLLEPCVCDRQRRKILQNGHRIRCRGKDVQGTMADLMIPEECQYDSLRYACPRVDSIVLTIPAGPLGDVPKAVERS